MTSAINIYMDNVIDFHQHRTQKQHEEVAHAYYNMFSTFFDIYLHYFVYPVIAAVATIHSKRIVKVSHY